MFFTLVALFFVVGGGYSQETVTMDDELLKVSRENPIELTKKGNKVFVVIPDEASLSGERYFLDALEEWGYWEIVSEKSEAHFIIVFSIDKKAMLAMAL